MKTGLFSLLKLISFLGIMFVMVACSSDSGGDSSTNVNPDPSPELGPNTDASYRVVLTTLWTQEDFPTNFPGGAHFTALIGGTHNEQLIPFWEPGQNASAGIERVAETGLQDIFSAEVDLAVTDGKAQFVVAANNDYAAAGTDDELEFNINRFFPLITLVSMVAPSPDWFIGVHGVSLFDDALGDWKQTVVVDLKIYDAGTEDGQAFSLNNAATLSVMPVTLLSRVNISDHDFVDGVGSGNSVIATITFERIK